LTSAPYLLVAPLALVLIVFFGIPLLLVVVVSFFDLDKFDIIPTFVLTNYSELFGSSLTYALYAKTIKYALMVWAITLVIGFTVSYFLVFHVRTVLWQTALFLLCTVPFWTSNVIRMISWIPFLGRNGIFNQSLIALGIVDQPLEFLLFSDFAVVIAYVHLFSLFMIAPIFNSMARIDPAVIEAAVDAGGGKRRGLAGRRHRDGGGYSKDRRCAERARWLAGGPDAATRIPPAPVDVLRPGGILHAVRAVPLRPHVCHLHPVVPGAHGRPDVPHERRIASLVQRSLRAAADGRFRRLLHTVDRARRHRAGDHGGGLGDGRPGLPPPLPRLDPRLLYGHLQPDHPGRSEERRVGKG